MPHILLGDDDEDLSSLLQEYLQSYDVKCDCAYDGEQVLEKLQTTPYDLLVLDVMMPKMDGLSVLKQLPTMDNVRDVPVIMLTAKGDEIDRIVGLELGADDYIAKPCNPRELLARINAVIKRTAASSFAYTANEQPLPQSRLSMDAVKRTCQIDSNPLNLTGTEFDLLLNLLRHKGDVVSKEWLSKHVLQRELQPFDRSIDVHISRLRKKLQPYHDDSIKAVRGRGYQLVI